MNFKTRVRTKIYDGFKMREKEHKYERMTEADFIYFDTMFNRGWVYMNKWDGNGVMEIWYCFFCGKKLE